MNLLEVLKEIPGDRMIYLGTDEGSKWLFISSCDKMRGVLRKINDHYRQAFRKDQDNSGAVWTSLGRREVAEVYRHSSEPHGIAILICGKENGRYWDYEEVVRSAKAGYSPKFNPERRDP